MYITNIDFGITRPSPKTWEEALVLLKHECLFQAHSPKQDRYIHYHIEQINQTFGTDIMYSHIEDNTIILYSKKGHELIIPEYCTRLVLTEKTQ